MGYAITRGGTPGHWILGIFLLLTATACSAEPPRWDDGHDRYQSRTDPVTIEVVDDRGREFRQHAYRDNGNIHRSYIEAAADARYSLRVTNRTNQRIGVVVAVDGRNILSGKKSYLAINERMYVLGPYQSADYTGWRTARDQVNRFYFTDAGDSYAAAWGDHSAMGVIAAAVYEEKHRYQPSTRYKRAPEMAAKAPGMADSEAGTGFGREEYSPSVKVAFDPQRHALAKYFYKYEWRETLCRHGVIDCHDEQNRPGTNRFWPHDRGDYAPYPPDWRHRR